MRNEVPVPEPSNSGGKSVNDEYKDIHGHSNCVIMCFVNTVNGLFAVHKDENEVGHHSGVVAIVLHIFLGISND